MKKFELRNLIKEIVQRKLNEDVGQNAYAVNKIVSENSIKDVKIMTYVGSHNLEIVEVYENNGVLYFSVNTDPVEQNETIQEIGEVGASEVGVDTPKSRMKDSDARSVERNQTQLNSLATQINKIDTDIAKLQIKKANLVRTQGEILKKINAIKDKQ